MHQSQHITVEITLSAPMEKVWECWVKPEHIVHWAFASDDWEAPVAENDVREGGRFKTVMAAKDKSSSFDFTGTYTQIKPHEYIEYIIDDGRQVRVKFVPNQNNVVIQETFEIEHTHSEEQQRSGWQSILKNFKRYVESLG